MHEFLRWFGARYANFSTRLRTEFSAFMEQAETRQTRVQSSIFTLHWLLSRFCDYALEVGAIAEDARVQLQTKAKQAFSLVWENMNNELRRIEARPPTRIDAIVSGVKAGQLSAFTHKGCVCVRAETLTEYLRQLYDRSNISISEVTAALRSANLLSLDASGKSTKKIHGRRYLCIPHSQLLKEAKL